MGTPEAPGRGVGTDDRSDVFCHAGESSELKTPLRCEEGVCGGHVVFGACTFTLSESVSEATRWLVAQNTFVSAAFMRSVGAHDAEAERRSPGSGALAINGESQPPWTRERPTRHARLGPGFPCRAPHAVPGASLSSFSSFVKCPPSPSPARVVSLQFAPARV